MPKIAQDVARYTALYIARSAAGVSASTRLVPLVSLLRGRDWPERVELLARFVAYGRTHGAWDDSRGYSEGSLVRVIEAVVAAPPLLPSVKADPDFLCGTGVRPGVRAPRSLRGVLDRPGPDMEQYRSIF